MMRLAAVLCLLLFQIQVFAASALGCLHSDVQDVTSHQCVGMSGSLSAADLSAPGLGPILGPILGPVPNPNAIADGAAWAQPRSPIPADSAPDASVDDCQKCALNLCASSWHLVPPPGISTVRADVPVLAAVAQRHFYRLAPERFLKPPIAASA
jgi:hypothetical protein